MGKSFDLFIDYKNKIPEYFRKYITRAKLFEFDVFPTETIGDEYYKDIKNLAYDFCLPFPVVAVEDKTSCVILWDNIKNAVGIEHSRGMMEICDTRNYLEEKSFKLSSQDKLRGMTQEDQEKSRQNLRNMAKQLGEYPIMIRWGNGSVLCWNDDLQKWSAQGSVSGTIHYLPKQDMVINLMENDDQKTRRAIEVDYMRGFITACEELLRMSMRTLFIKETTPKKTTKNKYKKTFERPTYTVVKPNVARKQMGLCEPKINFGSIKERRAHIRREHERELRSNKFKNKQGQTVQVKRAYVPAVWQGPSESEDKKHRYKIILDLPKGLKNTCE